MVQILVLAFLCERNAIENEQGWESGGGGGGGVGSQHGRGDLSARPLTAKTCFFTF